MTDIETPTAPTPAAPVANTNEFIVTHRDGREETVTLKIVRPSAFERWPNPIADEGKFMVAVCSRPTDWFDLLGAGEYTRLVEEAERVNPDYIKWWKRRLKAIQQLPPDVLDQAAAAVRKSHH